MGGKSTLRKKSVLDTTQKFDLMSWEGLTHALRVVKQAGLPNDDYNRFRDMVLLYAQNGGDAHTKKEIEKVLASAVTDKSGQREAASSSNAKNAPATSYTNAIKKKSAKPNVSTASQTMPTSSHAVASMGTSRPTPQFSSVQGAIEKDTNGTVQTATVPIATAVPSDSVPEVSAQQVPTTTAAPSAEDETIDAGASPADIQDIVPPVSKGTESILHDAVEAQSEARTAPSADTVSQAAVSAQQTPEMHKARIAEIKRLVNSRFGNPATLISQGNVEGQVYMQALLEAMKASGGGGSLTRAMENLEAAYVALSESDSAVAVATQAAESTQATQQPPEPEAAVKTSDVVQFVPQSTTVAADIAQDTAPDAHAESDNDATDEVATATPASTAPVVDTHTQPSSTTAIPSLGSVLDTMPLAHVSEMVTPEVPEETEEEKKAKLEAELAKELPLEKEKEDISDIKDVVAGLTDSTASEVQTILQQEYADLEASRKEKPVTSEAVSADMPTQPTPAAPEAVPETDTTTSKKKHDVVTAAPQIEQHVAVSKKEAMSNTNHQKVSDQGVPHIEDLPPHIHSGTLVTKDVDTERSKDEVFALTKAAQENQSALQSSAVTAGLGQLLDEWKHFKQSGMFGTGPSGVDHPLYATLRDMPMLKIISGEWDGADPLVIQSIKGYVDAWHHEQGITYDANETFEHYLRRVVQRILKRQR